MLILVLPHISFNHFILIFYLKVNEGLPATAYIKMIDIWLIFNLVVPFILIVIHTYMDTLRP